MERIDILLSEYLQLIECKKDYETKRNEIFNELTNLNISEYSNNDFTILKTEDGFAIV